MTTLSTLPTWQLASAAVCLVALAVAILTFLVNARRRAKIEAALKGAEAKPLGMFDLTRGDVAEVRKHSYLVIPERLWTYDGFYLEDFAVVASATPMPQGGTALELYFGPTLNWDIVFAGALALFVALLEFSAAIVLLPHAVVSGALLLFACLAAVYGAADIAEDLKLAAILKDWQRAGADEPAARIRIDGGEAAAANALTRIKIVTLTLSVLGAAIFLILTGIAKFI